MRNLNIVKERGREFTFNEWGILVDRLKKNDFSSIYKKPVNNKKNLATISNIENLSTTRERLADAKAKFDFNAGLIRGFKEEITNYITKYGSLSTVAKNGAATTLPAVRSLETYEKLNISLSRLISDLESELDLDIDEPQNPFE